MSLIFKLQVPTYLQSMWWPAMDWLIVLRVWHYLYLWECVLLVMFCLGAYARLLQMCIEIDRSFWKDVESFSLERG
jgi:hypothetical protein